MTIDEAYELIVNLNEEAHSMAWDTWVEADELCASPNEEDWDKADSVREAASLEQACYFREAFEELDEDTQQVILNYAASDESFGDEFSMWYGKEEYENDFG